MATVLFDADSIKERIINRLKAKESWADILFFSANQRLIDIFAEELAYDMQYDEKLTTEAKWSFAQQISSLMAETQFFNYVPYRKQGANGKLKISTSSTFNSSYALNIELPKFSVFSNGGDIQFCISKATSLNASSNYVYANVVQGTYKEFEYVANGSLYETITIENASIENTVLDVYVNNELYSEVANIREATSGSQLAYETNTLNDFSGIQIKFGNNNFGKKLNNGDVVLVKYLETLGEEGNIESSNIITTVESTFVDTEGKVIELFCTNDEYLTGGTGYENIESIRAKAPKAFQTGDRAINKEDYKSIIEEFNFVKKATCWGEAEVNIDLGNLPGTYIALEENVVHVAIVSSTDGELSETQKNEVLNELVAKKPPTDLVTFEKLNLIFIIFNVNAYVSDKKFNLSTVSNNITSILKSTYSIDELDFKKNIRYSDYTSLIDSVPGVDYHETTLKYYKFETFNNAYTADIKIEMKDIKPSSVKVFAKDLSTVSPFIQVAHDNGSGTIVADTGYTVAASSINYNTGIGNIVITSGLAQSYGNYSIKIEFETTSNSVLPTKRYQLISYGSNNNLVQYE